MGLHFPLMALIDYRGFRLIALSILPVGTDTIIYGSPNAGINIYAGTSNGRFKFDWRDVCILVTYIKVKSLTC